MRIFTVGTARRKGIAAISLVMGAALLLSSNAGGAVVSAQTGPSLRVVSPTASSTVSSPVSVQVEVQNANLKAADLGDQASQHLHYFIDIDPASVVQAGQPIPTGRDNIVHSAATTQTLNLPAGQHTVWVVMSNVNHIPLSPGVDARVSFTVQGATAPSGAAPAAPAGQASPGSMPRTGAGSSLLTPTSPVLPAALAVFVAAMATVAVLGRRRSGI